MQYITIIAKLSANQFQDVEVIQYLIEEYAIHTYLEQLN
jgi:hypothetical protein